MDSAQKVRGGGKIIRVYGFRTETCGRRKFNPKTNYLGAQKTRAGPPSYLGCKHTFQTAMRWGELVFVIECDVAAIWSGRTRQRSPCNTWPPLSFESSREEALRSQAMPSMVLTFDVDVGTRFHDSIPGLQAHCVNSFVLLVHSAKRHRSGAVCCLCVHNVGLEQWRT